MKFIKALLTSSILLVIISPLVFAQTGTTTISTETTTSLNLGRLPTTENIVVTNTGSIRVVEALSAVQLASEGVYTGSFVNNGLLSGVNTFRVDVSTFQGEINNDSGSIMAVAEAAMLFSNSTVRSVTNGGTIDGATHAINIVDSVLSGLTNLSAGRIQSATGNGVTFSGVNAAGNLIENSGSISGDSAIAVTGGAKVETIQNDGSIEGRSTGILIDGGSIVTIQNGIGGLISGISTAILTKNSGALGSVLNLGTIDGATIFAGSGLTVFNNSSEAIAGDILGVSFVENRGFVEDIVFTNNGAYIAYDRSQSGSIQGAGSIEVRSSVQPTTNPAFSGASLADSALSTINGDLTFNGVLRFDAKKIDDGSITNTRLDVTGTANLTGASVEFNVEGIELFAGADRFTFLTAGALTSDISTALALGHAEQQLTFNVFQSGNSLIAVIDAIDLTAPLDLRKADTRGGNNLYQLGSALNNAFYNYKDSIPVGSNLANAINALAAIDTSSPEGRDNYRRALSSLDADTAPASVEGALTVDTAAAGTVNTRLSALRHEYGISGAVAGDAMSIHGFWMQLYDSGTKQGVRDGVDGFDADTWGAAGGIDAPLSEKITAGLAFSYAGTDVNGKFESNSMSIDNYRLAFYGSYNAGSYYLDSQLAYAFNHYDTSRVIDSLLAPQGIVAKGDHDGDQFTLRIRGGYPIAFENGFFITPKAEMNYVFLREDGYAETGAGNLGLEISTEDVQVLVLGLGLTFAYPITTTNEITWIPELSVDYMYDTIGDEVEIDTNFIGVSAAAFITSGASAEQQAIKSSLRLRAFGQGNYSFSGGFDYVEKDGYRSCSLSATVRYDF